MEIPFLEIEIPILKSTIIHIPMENHGNPHGKSWKSTILLLLKPPHDCARVRAPGAPVPGQRPFLPRGVLWVGRRVRASRAPGRRELGLEIWRFCWGRWWFGSMFHDFHRENELNMKEAEDFDIWTLGSPVAIQKNPAMESQQWS